MTARNAVSGVTVREVMHPGVVSCTAGTGAPQIARIMSDRRVHAVAVLGLTADDAREPRVWGIVSDLDVLAAIGRPGPPATAADLAAEPVITVRPAMSLREAAEAMVRYRAHHVVVTEPERHTPLGMLSTLDVAGALAAETAEPVDSGGSAEWRG